MGRHWEKEDLSRSVPSVLPGGAALVSPPSSRAWVLIDDGAVARFGAAMAWADRQGVATLDAIVDGSPSAPGIIARRAAAFDPAPSVWAVDGTSLVAVTAAEPVAPEPLTADLGAADRVSDSAGWAALLAEHDLEVVHEHGVLRGEVLGLEVARTVGGRLEVGVGRHDRSARAEMRPGEDIGAALREAAEAVRTLRRPGAPSHPANTLARSRWLRAAMIRDPQRYGLASLGSVAPPLPWFDLPEAGAAPAVGATEAGIPVIVVCSVGVDLDLVPTAADCRLIYGGDHVDAELWLVVPEGDDLPVTRSLAARLAPPATVRTVPRNWASAGEE